MARSAKMLGLAAVLGAALVAAEVPDPSALAADDVCASGDETCALNALQTKKERSGALAAQEDVPVHSVPESIGQWEYDLETFYEQWDVPMENRTDPPEFKFGQEFFVNSEHCQDWLGYYYPRISFWTKEFMKREATVTVGDKEAEEKLYNWTNKASYLACLPLFDNRKGSQWQSRVNEYMKGIASDGGSFDMPDLDRFYYQHSARMITLPQCMFWVKSMVCDFSYWVPEYDGNTESDPECWANVDAPPYALNTRNVTKYPHTQDHPEYRTCMKKDLDQEFWNGICNYAGHYPEGFMNMSWGKGPPEENRERVLQCNAKLGGAQTINIFEVSYGWDPKINIMHCKQNNPLGCVDPRNWRV